MTRIYKYELTITDVAVIEMPKGAKMLTVQMQHGVACVWAEVDVDAPKVRHAFRVLGTGHPADDVAEMPYLGTIQLHGGDLVFHVFDTQVEVSL